MTTTERRQFEADLFATWQRRAINAETENQKLRNIIATIAPIFSQRLEEVLARTPSGTLVVKGNPATYPPKRN